MTGSKNQIGIAKTQSIRTPNASRAEIVESTKPFLLAVAWWTPQWKEKIETFFLPSSWRTCLWRKRSRSISCQSRKRFRHSRKTSGKLRTSLWDGATIGENEFWFVWLLKEIPLHSRYDLFSASEIGESHCWTYALHLAPVPYQLVERSRSPALSCSPTLNDWMCLLC